MNDLKIWIGFFLISSFSTAVCLPGYFYAKKNQVYLEPWQLFGVFYAEALWLFLAKFKSGGGTLGNLIEPIALVPLLSIFVFYCALVFQFKGVGKYHALVSVSILLSLTAIMRLVMPDLPE